MIIDFFVKKIDYFMIESKRQKYKKKNNRFNIKKNIFDNNRTPPCEMQK